MTLGKKFMRTFYLGNTGIRLTEKEWLRRVFYSIVTGWRLSRWDVILTHRIKNLSKWETQGYVDKEFWKEVGAQGLIGIQTPAEVGGHGGDFLTHIITCEGQGTMDLQLRIRPRIKSASAGPDPWWRTRICSCPRKFSYPIRNRFQIASSNSISDWLPRSTTAPSVEHLFGIRS